MNVADVMTRDVLTVAPNTGVQEIARLLWSHGISGVPVVDATGALVGIVSELDLLVRNANLHIPQYLRVLDVMIPLGNRHEFEQELRRALGATAADVMTRDVITVSPGTDLAEAATLMLDEDVNRLPVVDQGRVVGIISRADFVRLLAQDIPTEA
ncbi:MAG TPA: CBS domain-containing protein [Chloroflexota bacterium]|nr:CBS domain-containing protein [Chloroflexota bacterium]